MVIAMVGGGWCGLNTMGCKGHAHCHTPVWSDCGLIHTYVHTLMKNFTVALKGKSCVMYVIQHMPRRKRGTHE